MPGCDEEIPVSLVELCKLIYDTNSYRRHNNRFNMAKAVYERYGRIPGLTKRKGGQDEDESEVDWVAEIHRAQEEANKPAFKIVKVTEAGYRKLYIRAGGDVERVMTGIKQHKVQKCSEWWVPRPSHMYEQSVKLTYFSLRCSFVYILMPAVS